MSEWRQGTASNTLIGASFWGVVFLSFSIAAETRQVDRIAAVVGSEIILLSEVAQRASTSLAELENPSRQGGAIAMSASQKEQIIAETLDNLIDDTLVRQQATEMKLSVTSEEVDLAIQNVARENGLDLTTFEQAVVAQGKDMVTYRAEMRRELLRFKVLNLRVRGRVKISENEARQYYNDQVRDVRATGEFEGAHILIRVPENARAVDVANLKKKADEIRRRVESGEDFATLAEELSEDEETAKNGGSFGMRSSDEVPKALERSFLDMEQGELAGPIRTPFGFHVLLLKKREDLGIQSFAEVKNRIINQLMQDEMMRQQKIWLKELRLRTFIEKRL